MGVSSNLKTGFDSLMLVAGRTGSIEYYNQTVGSVWDDEVDLAKSGGTLGISGIVMPLDSRRGSNDSVLVEQGKLIDGDKKVYVSNGVSFTGSGFMVKLSFGGEKYTTIPIGVIAPEVQGEIVYKKAFIRRLTTGSLLGE